MTNPPNSSAKSEWQDKVTEGAREYWKQFKDTNRWDIYGDFKAGAEWVIKNPPPEVMAMAKALKPLATGRMVQSDHYAKAKEAFEEFERISGVKI